jgi:uncharacterized protein (DUF1330 family)
MPKGFVYADIEVTDPVEYEKYRQLVPATIAAFDGGYLVRGGDPEVLEGDNPTRRHVILEFASRERALEWYHSPQYRDVKAIRVRSTRSNVVILSGAPD